MMEKPSTAVLISKEPVRSDAFQTPTPRVAHTGDTGFMNQLEDAIAHLDRAEKPEDRPAEKHAELRNDETSPDRIREEKPDSRKSEESAAHADDNRRPEDERRTGDSDDREKRSGETEKRSDALRGDIRELLLLGKKVEKSQPTTKSENEKSSGEAGPRARVVERGHRESAETAAALFQLRREPVKEAKAPAESDDKKSVIGRTVKEGRERTMSLPQEALVQERTPAKRESSQDHSVVVRLNTEKWSVSGSADSERPSQQKNGRGERDHRDLSAERRITLAQREVRTENPDANTRTMFLDSMNSLRDPLRGMDRMEEKARVAQDNRNLFNELVEKARLNLGSNGSSSASIRMRPEALGTMTLNLRMQEGHLDAKLVVESKSAQKVMMEEIEHLKTELRAQGIQVDSFSIHIRESAESQTADTQRDPDAFQRAGENPEKNSGRDFRDANGESREGESHYERDLTGDSDSDSGLEPMRPIEARFEHVIIAGREPGVNISV